MRVFIDANVLFGAFAFPGGVCDKALTACMDSGEEILISDYALEEVKETLRRKVPERLLCFDTFLSKIDFIRISSASAVVALPISLRDQKDEPILRDAKAGHADVILTGDKDFLESGLTNPRPIHPAEFIKEPRYRKKKAPSDR